MSLVKSTTVVVDGIEKPAFFIIDWLTGDPVAMYGTERIATTMCDSLLKRGVITDADFTEEEMRKLGGRGAAFHKDNGTWAYPTPNLEYWNKARQAFGRSVGKERSRLKAYLVRRGNALGAPKEAVALISGYSAS